MNFEDYEKYRRLSPGQSAGGQWNVGVFSQDREERSCCAVWRCRYCRYRDASLSRLDADPAPTCSAVSYDTAADASNNNRAYLHSIYTLSTQYLHSIYTIHTNSIYKLSTRYLYAVSTVCAGRVQSCRAAAESESDQNCSNYPESGHT